MFVLLLCVVVLVRVIARCSCDVLSFVFFVIVPVTALVRGLVRRSCYLPLFLCFVRGIARCSCYVFYVLVMC